MCDVINHVGQCMTSSSMITQTSQHNYVKVKCGYRLQTGCWGKGAAPHQLFPFLFFFFLSQSVGGNVLLYVIPPEVYIYTLTFVSSNSTTCCCVGAAEKRPLFASGFGATLIDAYLWKRHASSLLSTVFQHSPSYKCTPCNFYHCR